MTAWIRPSRGPETGRAQRAAWAGLLVIACEGSVAVEPAPVVSAPAPVVVVDPGVVPREPAEIRAWLQDFKYRGWTAMTERRATGEHGGEQLFFNNLLATSWKAGAQEHPVGSAAVRELYRDDLETLKGFALMVKTGASGDLGEGWFWYEIFGTTDEAEPTVAEAGARGCVGCHSHAVDFVHSPDTPRVDPQPPLL